MCLKQLNRKAAQKQIWHKQRPIETVTDKFNVYKTTLRRD